MRTAFVLGKFPVLSETFVLDQITGLIDRGYEVDIYAQAVGEIFPMHHEVTEYGLLEKTRWAVRVPKNWFARLAKAVWLCARQGWKKPLCVLRCLNFIGYGKRALSLRFLYMVMPYMDARPYDVIACHFGPNGLLAALLKELGAIEGRIVTTFHAYDIYEYPRQHGADVYERLFARGELFMVVSEAGKDELLRLGCPAERLMLHRMGVDTQRLTAVGGPATVNGDISILSVARLVEKKGIEYGVRAVANLKRRIPQIKYTVIGDGPLRKSIEGLIDELGLKDTVELVGWKRRDEVARLLDKATVLLSPSVTAGSNDKEGIPVTIMEAMAKEVPVVSTRHSAIAELVSDGVSGFLVAERDTEALADRLGYVLGNGRVSAELGKAARRRIVADYELGKLNDRLAEVFRNVCGNDELSFRL